jgi:hypothetical protein
LAGVAGAAAGAGAAASDMMISADLYLAVKHVKLVFEQL